MDLTNHLPIEAAEAPEEMQLLLSGLDSLYVGFYMDPVGSQLDFADLVYQQAQRRDDRALEFEPLRLGAKEFLLRPFGRHPYKFVLTCEDYEIAFTERMQPNFYVKFLSKALWLKGWRALEVELREWFVSVGLRYAQEESVSRADWAFDYSLPNAEFQSQHFVSKASKDNTWRQDGNTQTISFGVGDTVIRIYDKVAEIDQQSDKSWFYQLWGCQKDVWRIEVQVRRERLKKAGIRTLSDLEDLSADLLREILGGHTTHRTPTGDTNRSRWPLSPLWQDLLRVIEEQPQTGLVAAYDPAKELEYRIGKSSQSILGYLKNLAALHGIKSGKRSDVSLAELLGVLSSYVEPYHNPADWPDDLERRIRAVEMGR